MSEIRLKRGETLNLLLQFSRTAGGAADVTHMVLSAAVRDAQDNLVATLPMVKQVAIGEVTISAVDTSQWPIGRLRCDLRAVSGGQVMLSDTFGIQVTRAVTQS